MTRFLALRADGMKLYWLDAMTIEQAEIIIELTDKQRPPLARIAFAVDTLTPITEEQFVKLPLDVQARRLETRI